MGTAVSRVQQNRRGFAWPKALGFAAFVFIPVLFAVLSAPDKDHRKASPLRILPLVSRGFAAIVVVALTLYIGDLFLQSVWLGSLYASTFPALFWKEANFLVAENTVDFGNARVSICGSGASFTGLGVLGIVLGVIGAKRHNE